MSPPERAPSPSRRGSSGVRGGLLMTLAALVTLLSFPMVRAHASKKPVCPAGMSLVQEKLCVDRYEATVVELDAEGKSHPHPHYLPVTGLRVKAVSQDGVFPQAYLSRDEAQRACLEAGKRLCSDAEWKRACRGKQDTLFPYGASRKAGNCNDHGVSPLEVYFHASSNPAAFTFDAMNDPRLDQLAGTVTRTGSLGSCVSDEGVFDMVGNLHEWTYDPAGTFRGGYFLDTSQNGDGCEYVTRGHDASYHDYSTGFRCCADPPRPP